MPIDDDYWTMRMGMSSADLGEMREQAEQNARGAYDADTRAMAASGGGGMNPAEPDGGDRLRAGVEQQMKQLVADRVGGGAQLRGMIPPLKPTTLPPGCIAWPLVDHSAINVRKGAIQQGDGNFGLVRHNDDGSPKMHWGLDITAPPGTPVLAAHGGKVSRADETDANYGKRVRIDGAQGLTSQYAHLSDFDVKPGQVVAAGQRIGWTGTTGNAAKSANKPGGDPHLHFEVYDGGKRVDPRSKLCPPVGARMGDEELLF